MLNVSGLCRGYTFPNHRAGRRLWGPQGLGSAQISVGDPVGSCGPYPLTFWQQGSKFAWTPTFYCRAAIHGL